MRKNLGRVLGTVVGVLGMAGASQAAFTVPATLSVTAAEDVASALIVALVAIWSIKAGLGFLRGR